MMRNILQYLNIPGQFIIHSLETSFRRWGKFVSRNPYHVIISCFVVTALCSIGWINFRLEHQANKLWIPSHSNFNSHKEWIDQNFPTKDRLQMMIVKAENILTPESLQKMFRLHQAVQNISVEDKTFKNICTKVAIADIFQSTKRRKKREAAAAISGLSPFKEETDEEYDYDYIWDDYDSESEYSAGIHQAREELRIDFQKYGRQKLDANTSESSSVIETLPQNIYCDLVESLAEKCGQQSLLEIWRYREDLIMTATREEILDAVNILETSPWFGHAMNYTRLLGGVRRNSSGHIVSASTGLLLWSITVPDNTTVVESQGSGVELELGDETSLAWEESFVRTALEFSEEDFEVLPNAVSSYGNESADAIFFDGFLMAAGYFLMLAYTCIMLGPLRCVENRVLLSLAGVVSVMFGFIMSIGIASLLNYPYTLVHAIMPFLCLGIGIDDMFVIIQCLNNVKRTSSGDVSIEDLMADTMAHAGVSITVTSVTDVVAFGVGYFTNMPGLQSFCIYASIGLGCIFFLQVSWLLAWLVLDEKRIRENKNGLLPCIVHQTQAETSADSVTESEKSATNKNYQCMLKLQNIVIQTRIKVIGSDMHQMRMGILESCFSSIYFIVTIILLSSGLLSLGVFGLININYKFDPLDLVPSDSYFTQFLHVNDENFSPLRGYKANIYTGHFNVSHLESMDWLDKQLSGLVTEKKVLESYNSWWRDFTDYFHKDDINASFQNLTDESFSSILSDFLFSKSGSQHRHSFELEENLQCGSPVGNITATSFEIEYLAFDGPGEHVPGKETIEALLRESGLEEAFSFNKIYLAWETDTIIGYELWRNLGLGISAIFLITFVLLANLQMSLMVMTMVGVTLVDIIGFLYLWDVTIDIVSCINVVISVGLCVDYSVHIAHAYITASGSRLQKTLKSLEVIGPAVLNGGVTTFLALILCGWSTSHTFVIFFKVFILTVVFGLYHGLCLLPVLLCLFGPVSDNLEDHQTEGKNKVRPQEDGNDLPKSIDEVSSHPVTILQNSNYDKDKKPDLLEDICWTP